MRWLIALLLGCAPTHHPKPAAPSDLASKLQVKYAGWLAELKDSVDAQTGWPGLRDCDGTKWAGEAAAGGFSLNLQLAEYEPGRIERRPKELGSCYPDESKSTVSNDMVLGYGLGAWAQRDLGALERLAHYGEVKRWILGSPYPEQASSVVLSPSGQGLIGRAIKRLGGDARPYNVIPNACLPVEADYEYELQTLGILFDGAVQGGVSAACLATLKVNAGRFPKDGLMAAAAGIYSGDEGPALSLLADDAYVCPSYVRGQLPQYCTVHRLLAAKIVLDRFP